MPVPVVSLTIYDIGSTTMHVKWQPVGGATGYALSYEPINATEPTKPKEVGGVCFFIVGSSWDFTVAESPLRGSYSRTHL